MAHVVNRLVFIGSTSRDLPEEREAVRTACDELGLAIVDMKDFPATDAGATAASLAQLDRAGVYVGIFAYRYGFVEPGYNCSVTECEYDHAGKRGLSRLCFLVHSSVTWPAEHVEVGQQDRLQKFKNRLTSEQVVRWFRNPDELQHQVYRALEHWLRQHGEGPAGPRNLPPLVPDFVGREDDLAWLEEQISPGVTLLGVQGQGGIGKTSLAVKLAERLAARYPDGQIHLALHGVNSTPLTVRDAQSQIIHDFHGLEHAVPEDDEALLREYRSTLAGKRVLLLLDNAASAKQVTPLLPPAGTEAVVLVTSRCRLVLDGLRVRDLAALPLPAAVALLQNVAPRLSVSEAESVADICGRLPLALRLAGGTLLKRPDLSAADYLGRLERDGRWKEFGPVEAAIRLSEEQLPDASKAAWPLLAVFAGGFEKRWAQTIFQMDESAVEDHLGALLEQNLLSWDTEKQFYRLHDLVREYALNRLDSATREEAELRHHEFVHAGVATTNAQYRSGGISIPDALAWFERIWAEILAAFKRIANWLASTASPWLDILLGVQGFLVSLHSEALWLGEPLQEQQAFSLLSGTYEVLGHPEKAIQDYTTNLPSARGIDDSQGESLALANLGLFHDHLGQSPKAIECLEQALAMARRKDHPRDVGIVLTLLVKVHQKANQLPRSVEFLTQSLILSRALGNRQAERTALESLVKATRTLGNTQQVLWHLKDYLAVVRALGDRLAEGATLHALGVHSTQGDSANLADAASYFEQALAIARELADRESEESICSILSRILRSSGRIEEANQFQERAVALRRELGLPSDVDRLSVFFEAPRVALHIETAHADTENRAEEIGKLEDTNPENSPASPGIPAAEVASFSDFHYAVFHPEWVRPDAPARLLVFCHLSGLTNQVTGIAADRLNLPHGNRPIVRTEQVRRSRLEARIHLQIEIPGLEFVQPTATLALWEEIECAEFRFRVRADVGEEIRSGRIDCFLLGFLVASLPVSVFVPNNQTMERYRDALVQKVVTPCRVFPSYSHADSEVVDRLEKYAAKVGGIYLSAVRALQSGPPWNPALAELIRQADLFQLCWTASAAESPDVEQEWRIALQEQQRRPDPCFVRPIYWSSTPHQPIPADLSGLQFTQVRAIQ
jgi:tetratricopeptide (TPR) repeat protein